MIGESYFHTASTFSSYNVSYKNQEKNQQSTFHMWAGTVIWIPFI